MLYQSTVCHSPSIITNAAPEEMKTRPTGFLKWIISAMLSIVKSKKLAAGSKANAWRTRLIAFSVLRNKKLLLSSLSHKLHALVGHHENLLTDLGEEAEGGGSMIQAPPGGMLRSTSARENAGDGEVEDGNCDNDDDKYPDLTHSLFDSEIEGVYAFGDDEEAGSSVIELVKSSKAQEGVEFVLEDEIDKVADLFIKRFHRQMWVQKQLSFKRYRDMLQRGA